MGPRPQPQGWPSLLIALEAAARSDGLRRRADYRRRRLRAVSISAFSNSAPRPPNAASSATSTLSHRFIDAAKRTLVVGRDRRFHRPTTQFRPDPDRRAALEEMDPRQLLPRSRSVGLLFPASVGGALANLGVTLAGKTAVNLNFTAGEEGMAHAISTCGISTILSSRAFLEKAKLAELPGTVYLEDLLADVQPRVESPDDGGRAIASRSLPCRRNATRRSRRGHLLERQHRHAQRRDALALEPDRERRRDRASLLGGSHRLHARRAAVLSLLRLHLHALVSVAATASKRCFIPIPPTPKRSANWRARIIPRCFFPRRPSAWAICANARANSSEAFDTCWWARKSCGPRW